MAFTLVEIVLALGIVSFALVSILGMIPVGLSTFRDAVEVSAETAIIRQLAADLQQADAATETSMTAYFNEQGEKVAASDAFVSFTAEILPPQPIEAGSLAPSPDARTVVIELRKTTPPSVAKTYSLVVLPVD